MVDNAEDVRAGLAELNAGGAAKGATGALALAGDGCDWAALELAALVAFLILFWSLDAFEPDSDSLFANYKLLVLPLSYTNKANITNYLS